MIRKLPSATSHNLFLTLLSDLINSKHELALLADKIVRSCFKNEFKDFYPGDEKIPFAWESNPYIQYFCSGLIFERKFSCDPSVFVHFLRRIGETGVEKIFAYSVKLHGEAAPAQAKFVLSDTTVQGNFTTFPTDAKLCEKVIDKCSDIAEKADVKQCQKYKKKSKQLLRDTYY